VEHVARRSSLAVVLAPVAVAIAAFAVSKASGASAQSSRLIRDLGTLGSSTIDDATALNERGQVVGFSHTKAGDPHAFSVVEGQDA
jgi:probable HAF family extracellular repeat protein